jgi:ribosome-associated heat shock protein Hsp15
MSTDDDEDDDAGEATTPEQPGDPAMQSVRLDKWLWAARCFKTRGLASEACAAGHVKVGGVTAKPSRPLKRGEEVTIKTGDGLRILAVKGLSDRRGPATVARTLYDDKSPPKPPAVEVPGMIVRDRGMGRPTKQERRDIRKVRGY